MDHTEFKQYLLCLEGLSPAQKRKLFDALRVKDEGETVAEALEKRISVGGHCPHWIMINFKGGAPHTGCSATVARAA